MRTTFLFTVVAFVGTSSALAGPVIAVLSAQRQGQLSLSDNSLASQLRLAILDAYPDAVFRSLDSLTPAGLAGCDTTILSSPNAGNSAIAPLTLDEQAALRSFVNGGGGALIFSDNDTFAGGASAPANASVTGPFGVAASGTGSPWSQTVTALASQSASPVINGPFGHVTSYSVGWSGWYPGAAGVAGASVLATLNQNGQPALIEFPPHALAPGSGRAVLFSDATMIVNGYFNDADRVVTLNALDATLPRCGPADVGKQGGFSGPDGQLDNNDFIAFINYFFASSPTADRGTAGGLPGHDGQFDNNDFIVFITQFFEGCA